jgi:hypothetical protein
MKTELISAVSGVVADGGSFVSVSVGLVCVASASIVGTGALVGTAVAWGGEVEVAAVPQAVRTTNESRASTNTIRFDIETEYSG